MKLIISQNLLQSVKEIFIDTLLKDELINMISIELTTVHCHHCPVPCGTAILIVKYREYD